MWRNLSQNRVVLSLFAGLVGMILVGEFILSPRVGNAQSRTQGTLDPTTERSLEQLQQLLMRGNPQEVRQQIKLITGGSGYIKQLAEIIYRLAQNETDGLILVEDYRTIIIQWPESAWAQKALVELVPLIIMSGGEWVRKDDSAIWAQADKLLAASPDAVDLGENPEDLRSDVFLQLLHLAHFWKDYEQVNRLLSRVPSRASVYQDQIDLAAAYAVGRSGNKAQSRTAFLQWLDKYPKSDLRSMATLAVYLSSEQESQLNEALGMMKMYDDTLEAMWLHSNLGQGL